MPEWVVVLSVPTFSYFDEIWELWIFINTVGIKRQDTRLNCSQKG